SEASPQTAEEHLGSVHHVVKLEKAELLATPANLRMSAATRPCDVGPDHVTGVFGEKYHHRNLCQEVLMTPNIADIIRHHVSLEVRCIDRVYLHAYMPKLQTSGGLCYFLHDYLGHPVPSPALLKPRHDHFKIGRASCR